MTAPGVFPDTSDARERALLLAVGLYGTRYTEADDTALVDKDMLATATKLWRWLEGPAFIGIIPGPVTDQETGQINPNNTGGPSMAQIRDHENIDLTLILESAKGNEVVDRPDTAADDVQWVNEGAEGVVEFETFEGGRKVTIRAVDTGSTVLRFTVPDTEPVVTGTYAVDVIAGRVTAVRIQEGAPYEQEAAPEPEPTPDPAPEV